MKTLKTILLTGLAMTFLACGEPKAELPALKIAYSDWPGWVAWDIGIQKGFFEEEGVDVDFIWFEYVASMDAFAAGQVDAVAMTNGDALVTGSTGASNVMILLNDYSNGNDMLVARPGIETIADLEGKKVGLEVGFVAHLLFLKALETAGVAEDSVEILNVLTHETAQTLASGDVDAIAAWQPNSGQALKSVTGSKAIFTSADAPGLIYDTLAVDPTSLSTRRDDWLKVVKVWYKIVDYLKDPANEAEVLEIMSARVGVSPAEYAEFMSGTYFLTLDEAKARFVEAEGFGSLYGSSVIVDEFNTTYGAYPESQDISAYIDSSLIMEIE
jgi:NitT/TauT family transport system substrate-binding protein